MMFFHALFSSLVNSSAILSDLGKEEIRLAAVATSKMLNFR